MNDLPIWLDHLDFHFTDLRRVQVGPIDLWQTIVILIGPQVGPLVETNSSLKLTQTKKCNDLTFVVTVQG